MTSSSRRADARIVLVDGDADALELGEHVGAARLIGDEKLALVADALRRDVLVSRRLFYDRGGVDAGFGGKRTLADIGRVAIRGAIEQFVERVRDAREAAERFVRHADLEFVGIFAFELQRRDDGNEVGVAAALAEPVERALDLARAGAHRGERIRHRLLGVVMGMDADMVAGNFGADFADDAFDLVRQRAAIGVAQHDPARAFVVGRLGASQRISGLGLVAVEEMFAVEQHFAALGLGRAHAVADRGEHFFFGGLQRDPHVIVPGFGDEADGVGLRVEQRDEAGIVGRRAARPPRHAEGGELCPHRPPLGEKAGIDRIGAGIAGLDIVDAQLVEQSCDCEFIREREIDAVGLRAVAQRGVEQIKAFAWHVVNRDRDDRPCKAK